jgi:hypothetical protein
MKTFCLFVALASAFLTPKFLHADVISTLTLSGATFQTGATGSGFITIDDTYGLVTGGELIYSGSPAPFPFLQVFGVPVQYPVGGIFEVVFHNSFSDQFSLAIPETSLVGYMGGPLCTVIGDQPAACSVGSGPDSHYISGVENSVMIDGMVDGSLGLESSTSTGTAGVTPEPSSFVLLGTGALSVAYSIRRRLGSI